MGIGYVLSKGFFYRHQLATIATSSTTAINTLLDLSPKDIKADGVKALALDFDGVLSYQDDIAPLDNVMSWLHEACQVFGEQHLFILTNNPLQARETFLTQTFPQMHFIKPTNRKPHPEGLQQVMQQSGVSADEVLLVDDRLTTGILATCIAGTKAIYIKQPYVNYAGSTLIEIAFTLLRLLERGGVFLLHRVLPS